MDRSHTCPAPLRWTPSLRSPPAARRRSRSTTTAAEPQAWTQPRLPSYAQLPKGIRPQGPATREAAPKSVSDFTDSLWWWLENSPGIRAPPELYDAWQRYIRLTSQYAADHGLACARAYHADCIEAAQRGWWHPQASGPCYTQAYAQHVLPAARPVSRWSRSTAAKADKPAASGFKRKAVASGQEVPETRSRRTCSIHPGASHTDADCLSQRDTRAPGRARDASGDATKQAATRR